MKKLNFLLLALCITCLNMNGQTKKKEFKLKKAISNFAQKVKKIENRDKKEKVLKSFVSKLKEINNKPELEGVSPKERKEFNKTLDVLIEGFDVVQGGSSESLNSYAEFVESEFNQASDATELLIYLSIPLIAVILMIILL